jgi:hypothetical protein
VIVRRAVLVALVLFVCHLILRFQGSGAGGYPCGDRGDISARRYVPAPSDP